MQRAYGDIPIVLRLFLDEIENENQIYFVYNKVKSKVYKDVIVINPTESHQTSFFEITAKQPHCFYFGKDSVLFFT